MPFKMTAALSATLLFTGTPASAQSVPMQSVNGTVFRCPPIDTPSAKQLSDWLETRPLDLEALSARVKTMMGPGNPAGEAFRAKQAAQRESDWAFLCRYRADNAAVKASGKRPAVVFMGDSITERWAQGEPAWFAQDDYVGRGISGQSSSQMVVRFAHDVVALKPRVVHLMAGTNDIGGATGPLTEDEYLANMGAMLDLARANNIKVVLGGLPPMSRLLPRPEFDVRPWVRRLNARLKLLAAERGALFVDYYTPMALANGDFDPRYANDGVHPTRAGYAIMKPLAHRAIAEALRTARR